MKGAELRDCGPIAGTPSASRLPGAKEGDTVLIAGKGHENISDHRDDVTSV